MLAFAALLFIIPLIQGLSTPPSALRYPFEQTPNWIKLEESPARIISQISWSSEKLSNGMTLQRDFITITTSIEVSRRFLDKWNVNVIGVQIVAEYTGDVSNLQPDIQVALHTSSVKFRDTDGFMMDVLVTIPPYNTHICNYHPPKLRVWPNFMRPFIGEETYVIHATMMLNVDPSMTPFVKPEDEIAAQTMNNAKEHFKDSSQHQWALFQQKITTNMTLWTDVTSCSCACKRCDLQTDLCIRDHYRRLHIL